MAEENGMKLIDRLSAATKRALSAVKPQVSKVAEEFGIVRESCKKIAPKIMQLYRDVQSEIAKQDETINVTLADFARMFDPTVPTHAAEKDGVPGYRAHRVYYALDYMKRTFTARPRGRQGVRDAAVDQVARTLATVLQIVRDAAPVWAAVQAEFNLGERSLKSLMKRVENTKPLIDLSGILKPINVASAKVIHMERAKREAAEGAATVAQLRAVAADLSRPGRRVRRRVRSAA